MRFIKFVVLATLCATSASASWFGSDKAAPEYTQWNQKELEAWLHAHNINVPQGYNKEQIQNLVEANWKSTAAWTNEQYQAAQKRYSGLKEDAFAAWDESTLRQFLLEQGIVAPSSTREQLVLMAKQQYRSYTSAASSLSAAASTAVYGDKTYQASASASSAAAQASATVARALDDSKDYIYSTWDDNQLRTWLEERGYIKTKQQAKRDELLAKMREHYVAASNPVWKAWSDSYMHERLVNHGIIRSDAQKKRDEYIAQLQSYYYGPRDTVYDTWSESESKQWLVDHGVIKSDAQVKKEKLQALVADNYAAASDTIWGGWHDSEMRDWLIQHGYLRSDAQVKRDELVKLMNDKYADASARSAEYLKWPDARLRAYLRSNGMSEEYLPTSRPTLLHEVRIRYVQTQNRVEAFLQAIRDTISGGVETAEEKLGAILEMLGGAQNDAKKEYNAKSKQAQKSTSSVKAEASKSASSAKAEASKSSSSLKAEASRKKEEL